MTIFIITTPFALVILIKRDQELVFIITITMPIVIVTKADSIKSILPCVFLIKIEFFSFSRMWTITLLVDHQWWLQFCLRSSLFVTMIIAIVTKADMKIHYFYVDGNFFKFLNHKSRMWTITWLVAAVSPAFPSLSSNCWSSTSSGFQLL